ncbi:MAG: hypothetical protein R2911_21255 [Caldilineaceae bacterium]
MASQWVVWLITLIVFSLMHLVNLLSGANLTVLLVVLTGGTLWYVSRRVFGNLFVSIFFLIYDTAFFLLSERHLGRRKFAGSCAGYPVGIVLVLFVGSVIVLFVGRSLFQQQTYFNRKTP